MPKEIRLHSLAELGPAFGLTDAYADPHADVTGGAHALTGPGSTGTAPAVLCPEVESPSESEAARDGDTVIAECRPEPAAAAAPADPTGRDGAAAPTEEMPALATLLAELDGAVAELVAVAHSDEAARTAALAELEEYDRLVAARREAQAAHDRAVRVREDAEALAAEAFGEDARSRAGAVAERARRTEARAIELLVARRAAIERLGERLDVARLLDERRRRAAEDAARAAAAERERRLADAAAGVRRALAEGQVDEAERLLADAPADSTHPDLAALAEAVARRRRELAASAAEVALRLVRLEYRRSPEEAIACLEALEVEGLPEELRRQVFGEWAGACARVCRQRGYAEPLRYAPLPGRGAVLARERPDADYVVLSALGMGPRWRPGATVAARDVGGARPLR